MKMFNMYDPVLILSWKEVQRNRLSSRMISSSGVKKQPGQIFSTWGK